MSDPRRVARIFVELADTLVEEFDPVDFLHMLTERAVEVLEVDAAGLLLADAHDHLKLVAYTVERARLLELFEVQTAEGPCIECFATGRPLINIDAEEVSSRWPGFAQAASIVGFGSTHALPLRLRESVLGTLNLFTEAPAQLSVEDAAIGQAMADIATIGLLNERGAREQSLLSRQLQEALDSRVIIEQAKGVLAATESISVDEAFSRLRLLARRSGRRLSEMARAAVDGDPDVLSALHAVETADRTDRIR